MKAVANVTMNRVAHEDFPNTTCGFAKQDHEQKTCQFPWWCDRHSGDVKEDKSYAIGIARTAFNRQFKNRTGGALYFHHRRVNPPWSKKYIKTAGIDKFIFYKLTSNKAN